MHCIMVIMIHLFQNQEYERRKGLAQCDLDMVFGGVSQFRVAFAMQQ